MSQQVTIRSLPDNVLLDIFDFYQVVINEYKDEHPWDWETLVHVCQRWRYLVLESPIRLNLQLYCTEKTPVRKLLHVWPTSLPITTQFFYSSHVDGFDNIVAALKHCDRVRQVHIANTVDYLWEDIFAAMQGPFPALRSLSFHSLRRVPTLPDTFLNGAAPCLQDLNLNGISFLSLPRLLLSTRDLTSLRLFEIPMSGYIPPVTMATSLSTLPKLENLFIGFDYSTRHSRGRNQPPPPPTRFVLPALTELQFLGAGEYFELLAAQIDAPLLDRVTITFFYQPIFDIPETIRFCCDHLKWLRPSSLALKFNPPHDASILLSSNTTPHSTCLRSWKVRGQWLDWQLSSVTHICSQILPFSSSVESLNIQCPAFESHLELSKWIPRDRMDPTLWSQLFHSFTSIHSLDISAPLEPFIAAALQGLTEESATEVLPSLHNLSIVGKASDEIVQQEQGIQSFVAARQRSSHPVIISRREVDTVMVRSPWMI